MNKLVALFYIVSSVFAVTPELPGTPLPPLNLETVFKFPVGHANADPRVSVEVHGTVKSEVDVGKVEYLRFLYLKPKLGADLSRGLATPRLLEPKVLPFTLPSFPGEELVELFGFSDCKSWYALNLHFWHPGLNNVTAKAAGYVKKDDKWVLHALLPDVVSPLPGLTFFDFVKLKVKYEFLDDLLELLPSHPVTLALAGHLPPPKKVLPVTTLEEVQVKSAPLNLDTLKHPVGHPALDKRVGFHVTHTSTHSPSAGEVSVVRFVQMVPKLGADLSGGLSTPGFTDPKVLPMTLPLFPGEALVELLAFSDCKTWTALNLEFWHPGLGSTTFRAAAFVKGDHGFMKHVLLPGSLPYNYGENFVDFVHSKVTKDHVLKLLEGLPSHPVVLALKAKWHNLL